jgi:hypothetical protein
LLARRTGGLHPRTTRIANDVLAATGAGKFKFSHNKLLATRTGRILGSNQQTPFSACLQAQYGI